MGIGFKKYYYCLYTGIHHDPTQMCISGYYMNHINFIKFQKLCWLKPIGHNFLTKNRRGWGIMQLQQRTDCFKKKCRFHVCFVRNAFVYFSKFQKLWNLYESVPMEMIENSLGKADCRPATTQWMWHGTSAVKLSFSNVETSCVNFFWTHEWKSL